MNRVPLKPYSVRLALLVGMIVLGSSAHAASPLAGVKHVLVIGCDGMSPDCIQKASTPILDKLMLRGAHTYHARAVMPTVSSPNWASMIMGAGPEQHGVTSNDWQPDKFEIEPTGKGPSGLFPTVFCVLREQQPDAFIACIHHWDGFGRLLERPAVNILENPIDQFATTKRAIEVIEQHKPVLTFVHLDHVDGAGHEHGHGTSQYYAAVEEADRLIGMVLETLDKVGMLQSTVIIVTADHGGKDKGHGGATMVEIEIPWIIVGPGVAPGKEITAPVNTYDTAATIAHVLGLETPDCWIARPVLSAFKP